MSFSSMLQMAKGKDPPASLGNSKPQRPPLSNREPLRSRTGSEQLYIPSSQKNSSVSHPGKSSMRSQAAAKQESATNSPVQRKSTSNAPEHFSRSVTDAARPMQSSVQAPGTQRSQIARSAGPVRTSKPKPAENSAASRGSRTNENRTLSPPGGVGKKRMSFKEVMKQAASIDKAKLEMNLRVAKQQQVPQQKSVPQPRRARRSPSHQADAEIGSEISSEPRGRHSALAPVPPPSRSHAPVAQPFPELLEKYNKRKQQRIRTSRRDDDDLDGFVVSEDEEGTVQGEESIWSLFNRKPKTYYADYDSDDDMEATGRDIFDEERRSAAQARREDVEEERKLEELARKKEQRRGGR